jgi:hypothetical protein
MRISVNYPLPSLYEVILRVPRFDSSLNPPFNSLVFRFNCLSGMGEITGSSIGPSGVFKRDLVLTSEEGYTSMLQ